MTTHTGGLRVCAVYNDVAPTRWGRALLWLARRADRFSRALRRRALRG